MDLRYDPEDEDAFTALSERLLERFGAAPEGADHGWVANQLLSFKQGYLGGDDLGRWTSDDLSEVLFRLYPRKVVLEPGDNAGVIGGIAAFLRFLAAEGLWTGDESSEELASLVEQAAARFDVAMADESRWGPGKRLFSGAAAQGVDIGDQRQLDEYIRTFNALPYAERDARLGPQLTPPRLPPVVVLAPLERQGRPDTPWGHPTCSAPDHSWTRGRPRPGSGTRGRSVDVGGRIAGLPRLIHR